MIRISVSKEFAEEQAEKFEKAYPDIINGMAKRLQDSIDKRSYKKPEKEEKVSAI
jgi:hypothetical protein